MFSTIKFTISLVIFIGIIVNSTTLNSMNFGCSVSVLKYFIESELEKFTIKSLLSISICVSLLTKHAFLPN